MLRISIGQAGSSISGVELLWLCIGVELCSGVELCRGVVVVLLLWIGVELRIGVLLLFFAGVEGCPTISLTAINTTE